ncbi:putative Holliday junction resolvase [Alkalispirillum mobile]|uniref:Putative pre-16S rRNA nuclease n=1 Tax=Alkalispirillum mobile TaxID=85925 RepID=A0A498C8H8_9GAMM|nr:Holliday junction resolvase RuvX [Alkalispirillum mobile]RLK51399.1 putative Holliday junction resolvase [Alkalispirillum mobile]
MPEPVTGTWLAFDHGGRRIGVAVGEALTGTGRALCTLAARDGQPDWERVARLLDEWRPAGLVVGLPLHADGSDSHSTRAARKFAQRLHGRHGLRVELVDERLSSHEAEARLAERGGRGARQPGALDSEAARVILETWFNQQGCI